MLNRTDNDSLPLDPKDALLRGVAEAARRLLAINDFDEAVNGALEAIASATGIDRAYISKYDIDPETKQQIATCPYEWTAPGIAKSCDVPGRFPMSLDVFSHWLTLIEAGEAVQGLTCELPKSIQQLLQPDQVLSLLVVPIMSKGRCWGSIGFDDCTSKRIWNNAEIAVLETAAACVGGAIERDYSRKEQAAIAQARTEELSQVNSILQTSLTCLASEPDLNAFLGHVTNLINQAVGALSGYVFLYDKLTNTLKLRLSVKQGQIWIGASATDPELFRHPFPADITPAYPNLCTTHEIGLCSIFIDVEPDLMWPGSAEWHRQSGHKEAAAVALFAGDRPLGMLGLTFDHSIALKNEDRDLIRALADQASLAIQLANLAEKTKQTALLQEREAVAKVRIAELAERDRILETTATAANIMLTEEDFNSAVNTALRIVGQGLDIDRVLLGKHFEASFGQAGYFKFPNEWISADTLSQMAHPTLSKTSDNGLEEIVNGLRAGEIFGGIIDELPEPFHTDLKALGVKSTYSIPILVKGHFWGVIALDDCHRQTQRSEAELEAMRTLAHCVGSAIEREQLRQAELQAKTAREAAERAALVTRERAARATELEVANGVLKTRDLWLETTATAANQLLSNADIVISVNTALQTIGSNLKSDRLGVMRHVPDNTELGHFQILYEWAAAGTVYQINNQELNQLPASDFADWTRHLMGGQPVGGPVAEQSEPFRSKMQSLGNLSAYAVPIFIEAEFWGLMFMDYCCELRQLTPAELAVFNTAATCIGSAIHREQMRRDREQAERDTLLQQEREQAAQKRAATLETYNRQLQQRDRLLNSVNAAAQCLVANEDLETALPTMLQILGEGTEQCRAYILHNSPDEQTGKLLFNLMLEWNAPDIPPKMKAGARFPVPIDAFPDHLTAPLKAGQATQFLARELDGLSPAERAPGQVLSLLGVPITVRGEWWGLLGLDDCVEERVWSNAEIAVLETAAAAIGSALERDHSRRAREAAEKAVLKEREKAAQERAAELAKTNEAIAQSLTTLATNPELEPFLGTIIAEMARQLNAGKVHLFLYDESTHTLTQRVVVQDGQVYLGAGPNDPEILRHPVPADITPGWQAILTSNPPLTYDETLPYDKDLWWPETIPWHQAQGHKAVTCIPMQTGDTPIGFIGFCFYDRTTLGSEQLEFMQALANQAIVALQLTRLAEQARTNALTDERNRLAREIHDTLAQAFTGVSLQLEAAKGCLNRTPEDAKRFIDNAGQLARRGLSEARRSVHALRSHALETNSLPDALRTALREMTQGNSIQTHFQLVGLPFSLPEDIKTNLLRIGQEAITNTLRHAQAQNLNLTLYFEPQQIRITINDDGKGCQIDPLANLEGFGLLGMRERALRFEGQFYFTSKPGQGTEIDIIIPIEHV